MMLKLNNKENNQITLNYLKRKAYFFGNNIFILYLSRVRNQIQLLKSLFIHVNIFMLSQKIWVLIKWCLSHGSMTPKYMPVNGVEVDYWWVVLNLMLCRASTKMEFQINLNSNFLKKTGIISVNFFLSSFSSSTFFICVTLSKWNQLVVCIIISLFIYNVCYVTKYD